MTSTLSIPDHARKLLNWLQVNAPVLLTDEAIFECWRDTNLGDLEIISALDFLALVGLIVRSDDRKLKTEVRLKL